MEDVIYVIKTNDGMGERFISGLGEQWVGHAFVSWKAKFWESWEDTDKALNEFLYYHKQDGLRAWVQAIDRGDT